MSMKKYVCWADLFFLSIYLFTVLSRTIWNQKKFFNLIFIQFIYYSSSSYICNYNRVTFVLYLAYYNFSLLVFGFRIIDNIVFEWFAKSSVLECLKCLMCLHVSQVPSAVSSQVPKVFKFPFKWPSVLSV